MPTTYSTATVADFEAVLAAIEAAAATAGWTTAIGATSGATGDDAGDTLTLDNGNDFIVTIRSVANLRNVTIPADWNGQPIDAPGILIHAEFDDGVTQSAPPILPFVDNAISHYKYIGAQPYRVHDFTGEAVADTWVAPTFPVTYHIFVHTDPGSIVVVVETGPGTYQWIIFGEVIKYGTWTGGGYYGASGNVKGTSTSGSSPSVVSYSLYGESDVRSFAPFHRMDPDFNRGYHAHTSNTMLHIDTGTAETEIDDFDWAFNMAEEVGTLSGGTRAVREVVANPWYDPLPSRSPNSHNEVSVMMPYYLATQRASHRVIVGRLAHVRHIPVNNFNAGDIFELGTDEWMVFPYFQREGFTGLHGWAIRKSEGA